MKIIVCGGRDYKNLGVVFDALDTLRGDEEIDLVIQGGAPGADEIAATWAKQTGIACHEEPANWKEYGRSAGPIRNALMADMGADLLVAFPGGAGTANMIKVAKSAGIPVLEPTKDPRGTNR